MAWCTVWKGVPQDLTDHVRYVLRVPVTRKVYTESLTSRHSGISNDITV